MSDVLFDTWAWFEVLGASAKGKRLLSRYEGRIQTSVIAVAEAGLKVGSRHGIEKAERTMLAIESNSKTVHEVTLEDAKTAVALRPILRQRDRHASLGDALVLSTARRVGLPLVSGDPAFAGEADVLGP
jgi:predicted nucleic acid-binding protein